MRSSLVVVLALLLSGCAHAPSGGSVVRGLVGGLLDAATCGGPLLGGGQPSASSLLTASTCFIGATMRRAGHEAAPTPSVEHGERVVEAARAAEKFEKHPCERHRSAAAEALRLCGWKPE